MENKCDKKEGINVPHLCYYTTFEKKKEREATTVLRLCKRMKNDWNEKTTCSGYISGGSSVQVADLKQQPHGGFQRYSLITS